jgi:hypothetical protein
MRKNDRSVTGPCLQSTRPYARRDGYSRTLGLDPTRGSEAPHKHIRICVDRDELVLRDVRKEHRVPTARSDPAHGVTTLAAVGIAHPPNATYKEPRFVDYLVGLDRDNRCVFHSDLGWPTEDVKEFCEAAGLRYGGHTDLDWHRTLKGTYPPNEHHIHLWQSRFPFYAVGCLVVLASLVALELVGYLIYTLVRHL